MAPPVNERPGWPANPPRHYSRQGAGDDYLEDEGEDDTWLGDDEGDDLDDEDVDVSHEAVGGAAAVAAVPQSMAGTQRPSEEAHQLRRRTTAEEPSARESMFEGHRRGKCQGQEPPPPTGLAFVLHHAKQLSENGVLIQGVGIPLRHVLALWGLSLFARGHVSWRTSLLAVFLWVVSGLGVTAGAHRLWTHQAYRASPVMEWLVMLMFSMADQGPIRGWSLTHAMHHSASDTESDPHNRQEGWWHAHFGWLYSVKRFTLSTREHDRVIRGLGPAVHFHDTHFLYWDPLWSHLVPGLIAALWGEPLNGLLFAGAFRWMCVQHITFFVNSVAHGERIPGDSHLFDTTAEGIGPRVSLLTTLLALGEGWHDYHHLFPWDYAAAELDAWDQWNPTKVFIDACCSIGIASGRRRCTPALQEARRRQLLEKGEGLPVPGAGEASAKCSFKVEGPPFFRRRVAVENAA